MGNQNNNFSNKSQQLSLYHSISHSPSANLTRLLHKHTNSPFLLKTITTDSQQKCKQIKRIIMKKIDHRKVPITQLQHAFLEENEEFCGRGYQIGLVFEVGGMTLKEDVERRREKGMFEEKELMGLMKRLVMAVSFFKQVEQRHEMVSLSNVYLKEGQFILGDPWISTEQGVCQSPERLDVTKNGKVDYDWFGSDLYSIGMVALEAYHLRSMSYLYENKKIDEQKLREEVRLVKYKDVQKLVRQLLGPPRLRIQALSSLLSFSLPSQPSTISIPTPIPSYIPSSPLKSHNLLPTHKQQIKRQAKKQMKRELKQTKEQIKKMIQSNSTRQIQQQPLFKIKTRIDPQFKSKDKRELSRCRSISKQPSSIQINRSQQKSRVVVNNIYNYNSHIHIHPPAQQIRHHTTINLIINEYPKQQHQPYKQQHESPQQGKSRHHHSHTRSNSGLLYFPTNSASHMKPSTGSTYHIRSNSTLSNNQESYVTIREEQSKEYSKQYQGELGRKELYTTPFDHIKDPTTKGVLNTTVSEHNFSMNNNSLHSLSNSIANSLRHQPHQFNNMLVQQYMKQYSSVVNISNIDQLNINSSIISNPSHSNLNSNHTIINTKCSSHSRSNSNLSNNSISSSHSHRSIKEINTLAPTQQPQIYQQSYGNRSIVNENEGGVKDQSSLLYSESRSKSMSRTVLNVMQQQSETSFDLPMLIKMESQMSRQSSVNDTESQLLASQFTQKTNKSNHSVKPHDNQPNRLTALISSPSYQYQGKLKNNLKQGQGKLFSSSGKLIYQGEWRNNEYQGYGKLVNQNIIFNETNYKDLDLKRGNWINYEGSFIKGKMYGFGKIVFCGGEVYEGEFVEGEISGFGQFFDEMEEVVDGVWKGGKLERLI